MLCKRGKLSKCNCVILKYVKMLLQIYAYNLMEQNMGRKTIKAVIRLPRGMSVNTLLPESSVGSSVF